MTNNTSGINTEIKVNGQKLQIVTSFKCLGTVLTDEGLEPEIDTLQDSTDNSSIDKVETSLEWQEYFFQFQDTTDALPCQFHLPVCLWIMDPHSRAPKKNTSHRNGVLPQDTTHPIQRWCYQQRSLCQDPIGNRTTCRPPDHRKETQTAVVWTCLLFFRSGKTILQSTVKGGRRQGRQKNRWKDNIREWTGLGFAKSQRAVKNRETWMKLVVKSSVVPQWPSGLRDMRGERSSNRGYVSWGRSFIRHFTYFWTVLD